MLFWTTLPIWVSQKNSFIFFIHIKTTFLITIQHYQDDTMGSERKTIRPHDYPMTISESQQHCCPGYQDNRIDKDAAGSFIKSIPSGEGICEHRSERLSYLCPKTGFSRKDFWPLLSKNWAISMTNFCKKPVVLLTKIPYHAQWWSIGIPGVFSLNLAEFGGADKGSKVNFRISVRYEIITFDFCDKFMKKEDWF